MRISDWSSDVCSSDLVAVRKVDRTITEVAAAHGGRYSIDNHLSHDPTATERFAEAHVRRLGAIRRKTGAVEREPDGSWVLALDQLPLVENSEQALEEREHGHIETPPSGPKRTPVARGK